MNQKSSAVASDCMAFAHHVLSIFALKSQVEARELDSMLRDNRARAVIFEFFREVVAEVGMYLLRPVARESVSQVVS